MERTPEVDCRILETPWSRTARADLVGRVDDRPLLLVDSSSERVRVPDLGLDLPSAGRRQIDGREWSAFELLGTGREGDGSETLELELGSSRRRFRVELHGGVSGIPLSGEDVDEDHAGMRVLGFLGRYVELVYGPIEAQEKLQDGCAAIDFGAFLDGWKQADENRTARLALIVRIATQVGGVVRSIGDRPRRVLRRRRAMERVASVRQIDPAGIRWLVRQPGSNLAERAGPRQRVLAVIREETVDTLENRVVRDLLERCVGECRIWQRENRDYKSSERYGEVAHFASVVRRLRRAGPLQSVRRALGTVEPNYVLQHDGRYSRVWPWYLKLRRRQQEEDRLWRWRHRTFADAARVSFAWALQSIQDGAGLPQHVGFRRQLLLRPEQHYGSFIDPRTELAMWLAWGRSGRLVALSLLSGSHVAEFDSTIKPAPRFADLSPDALIVAHDPFQAGVTYGAVAVWARLRFWPGDLPREQLDDLVSSLEAVRGEIPVDALIVQPGQAGASGARTADINPISVVGSSHVRVHIIESPLRVERAVSEFQSVLKAALLR